MSERFPRPSWLVGTDEAVRAVPWSTRERAAVIPLFERARRSASALAPAPSAPSVPPVPSAPSVPPAPSAPSVPPAPSAPSVPPPPPEPTVVPKLAASAPAPSLERELADARDALAQATIDLALARTDALARVEEDLARAAVEIAAAILDEELRTSPELHRSLARAALEALRPEGPVRVRVSRDAFDAIVDHFGSARISVDGSVVEVIDDPSLSGFGCVAESGESRVDARLVTRLDAVRAAVRAGDRG